MKTKLHLTIFMILVQMIAFGSTITSTPSGGNWSATSTWIGGIVPSSTDNVIVNGAIILDTDIIINNTTYTFNANVTDNGTHLLTVTNGGKLIISNNSTTTFGGLAQWSSNSSITVNTGSNLIIGALSIANNSTISIAGSLTVNGNITDNNNGGGTFSITGFVQVNGNYSAPVGSVSVSGAGIFQTTGSITTQGSSTVGGTKNDCSPGPCSSGSITCDDGSFTSSVTPSSQSLCSGQPISQMSFNPNRTGTLSYQWQSSTTNGGTDFTDIPGATSSNCTPPQPSVTTWYRMKFSTTTGCSDLKSPSIKITVNALPTIATTTRNSNCGTGTVTLGATASAGTVNWYAAATGGVSLGTGTLFTTPSITNTTTYYVDATANGCTTASRTAVVATINAIPTIATTVPNSNCGTGMVTLGATASAGTVNWYAAPSGGTSLGTGTSFTSPSISSTTTYYVDATNISCTAATRTAVMATINSIPDNTSTGFSSTSFCAGTQATITFNANNGSGTLPFTLLYKANNSPTTYPATISTNNPTPINLTPNPIATTDYTLLSITDAKGCVNYSSSDATATVTINPNLPASATIGATATTICSGTSVTFTATPTNGGITPTYQWKLNGNNVGTNSASYISSALANGDALTCIMTSNAICPTGSPATSNTVSITVNPNLIAALNIAPSANPVCSGTSVTFTASPTNGGTSPSYQWKLNGSDVGTNSIGYINSELANGDVVSCTLTSNATCAIGSPATSNIVSMTINNFPTAPIIAPATIIQPSCTTTGSVILNGLPTGNWTINPGIIAGSGTSKKVTGLTSGMIKFTVTDALGCTSPQSSGLNLSASDKTWVGTNTAAGSDWFIPSNWDPAGVPSPNDCVVIADRVVTFSDTNQTAYANTLTVSSNGKLEVTSGNILVVTDFVNVNPGATLTLQNNGSLVQINNAPNINTGTINVTRNTTPIVLNDYTYWSSPTSGSQTLQQFSPNSNLKYFLSYDNGWSYTNASKTPFSKGIGYAILSPKGISSTVPNPATFTFTGTPNNGNASVHVKPIANTFSSKLIGNPYPSPLDADQFIQANLGTITGTLYFWTHNHPYDGAVYKSADYAAYNLTGGAGTAAVTTGTGNKNVPTRWIASGQGFIVEVKAEGDVAFTNDMRAIPVSVQPLTTAPVDPYNNANFYKNANIANTKTGLEKNRIWLNMTDTNSNFSQALIGYVETATNGNDPGFDGTYNSNSKTGLYSLIGNGNYTIQGRAIPFSDSDVVPLGYKTDVTGNLTVNIDSIDGLFIGNQDIFLEDKSLNTIHNLKVSPYIFTTEAGTFNNRFILRYTDSNLGLDDSAGISNNVTISTKNQQIKIQSTVEDINNVFIYDMLGRTIYKKSEIDGKETLISDLKTQQVLIVKIVLANGHSVTKKVVNQ